MTIEELTLNLAQAQSAQHALMLGERVVRVTGPDGTEVEYHQFQGQNGLAALEAYVARLAAQLAALTTTSASVTTGYRPISFLIG